MASKKEVKAAAMVKDLRLGAGPTTIMEKYKLSEKGFQSAIRKLVLARLLRQTEIERFHDRFPDLFVGDLRQDPRKGMKSVVIMCDVDNPSVKGFVRNISENGIAVEGFEAKTGETKRLKILSSEVADCATFVLEAKCVWTEGPQTGDQEPLAGFKITSISKSALDQLKKLI
jgi:hypothetical protein